PENKDKNRFSNVLACECLHTHTHTLICVGFSIDVIVILSKLYFLSPYPNPAPKHRLTQNVLENVPGGLTFVYCLCAYQGYANASRQYIAAQGPLPSTVNDFWRMVWEKRSQVIVMLFERTIYIYIYMPCIYGHLLVSVKSEDKFPSWTLREFNKTTSETRTVRHFHFTAWPDHGVPTGTEELIQFRGRIRQHVESSFSAGPTIVHCSAGVGRTGTLIALDVLLQQLDKEKAVGISAFVQQMRLSRPLMVQTEVTVSIHYFKKHLL
uniref:protein-tyrosine-phosphatase n=1 Tax=Sinocyclocheilus anshuiensis TaxID=1608454 RepID=A0A671MV91_9TELE